MIHLYLTRKSTNKTACQGILTDQDGLLLAHTLEGPQPQDGKSYVGKCVPVGDYTAALEPSPLRYKGVYVQSVVPVFNRVPWFPYLSFATQGHANRGRICLCEMADEFDYISPDDAMRNVALYLEKHFKEGRRAMTLHVALDENFVSHNYTRADIERAELIAQEKIAREEARRLFEHG